MPSGVYKRTKKHKQICKENGFQKDHIPWTTGKHLSEIHKQKIGKAHLGKKKPDSKDKTYEEIYGIRRSKKLKRKISTANIGISRRKGYKQTKKHREQT